MLEKTCRCGKTKKNFVIDIGPFFIEECCIEAGFDHLGNKKITAEDVGLTESEVADATNPEVTDTLEVVDGGELPDTTEESQEEEEEKLEETPEQAKARKKAEKEAKKAAKKAQSQQS